MHIKIIIYMIECSASRKLPEYTNVLSSWKFKAPWSGALLLGCDQHKQQKKKSSL